MRHILFSIVIFLIIFWARQAYCDWEEMIQVNTSSYEKQAPRDSDCPWPIAADRNGNVYTIWEDRHNGYLEIWTRKRNSDGSWNSQEKISNEPEIQIPNYGHPSICVLLGNEPPWLLACYVRENDYNLPRELRGNTFDGTEWGDPSFYISDDDNDPNLVLPNSSSGWGTNIVALSDGKAYAFWQYIVSGDIELWFNEYDQGWTPGDEKVVYDDDGYDPHNSRHENACVDDDDNIHLVYSDDKSGPRQPEAGKLRDAKEPATAIGPRFPSRPRAASTRTPRP